LSANDVMDVQRALEDRAAARLRGMSLALQRLGEVQSVARMVAAIPHELCSGAGFDRAMLSIVKNDRMVFRSLSDVAHPVIAADFARMARAVRPRLDSCGPEHEAVVRQTPLLVSDAQTALSVFRPLVHATRTQAYVVAPVTVEGRVVALLHADRFDGDPQLTKLDREILWTFATGIGWIMERLSLRAGPAGGPAVEVGPAEAERPAPAPVPDPLDARLQALTARELEVLRLMAEGASNAGIGQDLVISQATVKSHVRHILRKLRASNRTEAVSQFLAARTRGFDADAVAAPARARPAD
jgi:DNA-binding CsgD family transcriptional regulator